ncbi:hypothetical protein [Reyranella sp.]|uniref:hypothetical protein n=1 Tax=Reyranella sp. TaxID=1929291 RepID=UPI003D116EB6
MSADVGNGQVREIEEILSAFIPTQRPVEPVTPETLTAAHRISRQWTSSEAGTLRAGTPAHRRALCAMLGETFNPYRPSVITWPELDAEQLQRLKALPIWDIAVQTEGRAQLRFAAYANSLADADLRAAILLNAWEENRHKQVLSKLVVAYGINLAEEPPYEPPRDVEWAFLVTGYSECIDSFFAFGLFDLARRSGFFPMELVETFEPVIQEECRHILFFANWLAWHRANLPWWRRPFFELRVAAVWIHIGWLRARLARTMSPAGKSGIPDPNFTLHGAKSVTPIDLGFRDLVALCLTENDRRFAGYDSRLVRPTTIPSLFRFMLGISKIWMRPKR